MTVPPLDYEALKALSVELDRPVESLIAQSPNTDPFYAGLPRRRQGAEWLVEVWDQLNVEPGIHLRRLHYRLFSQVSPIALNRAVGGATHYVNTYNCWTFLCQAAADARYLGLIPVEDIHDNRNEPAIINYDSEESEPSIWTHRPEIEPAKARVPGVYLAAGFEVPTLPQLPQLFVSKPKIAQPVGTILWIEKSGCDDILEPLCARLGVNLVSGAGEISVTRCYEIVQMARRLGKPVRVFTISDFDPAGHKMPVGLARKVEFFIRTTAPDLDVKVQPIAITYEQCVEFQLPRAPIKDSDRSAPGFEERYGEGATEIEALIECRPGELERIVEQAVSLCRDEWLDDALDEAEDEAQAVLDQIEAEVHAEHADEVEQLKAEWDEIAEEIDSEEQQFRDQVEPILADLRVRVREFHDQLEPQFLSRLEGLHERAKALWHVIGEKLDDQAPAEFDWPEPEFADVDDALYDSQRGYLEQVDIFRTYSGLPLARRSRKRNGGAP